MTIARTRPGRRDFGRLLKAFSGGVLGVLAACSTATTTPPPALDGKAAWGVLPISNHAQAPQAGERVESILAALLRAKGLGRVELSSQAEAADDGVPELDDSRRYARALDWCRARNIRYGVAGSVEEWGYKSGAEAEPAVGVTVFVVDVPTGRVLWTGTTAGTGWGRESTSAVAQQLLARLLAELAPANPS